MFFSYTQDVFWCLNHLQMKLVWKGYCIIKKGCIMHVVNKGVWAPFVVIWMRWALTFYLNDGSYMVGCQRLNFLSRSGAKHWQLGSNGQRTSLFSIFGPNYSTCMVVKKNQLHMLCLEAFRSHSSGSLPVFLISPLVISALLWSVNQGFDKLYVAS